MSRNPFLEMLTAPEQEIPGTFWATVTATNPLRVKRDAEPVLPVTPQTLANLAVGDRVLCLWERRQVIILGRMGGPGGTDSIVIDGSRYARSGSIAMPTFTWAATVAPVSYATVSVPIPFAPPSGWTFAWSVQESGAFTIAQSADRYPAGGLHRVRLIQINNAETIHVKRLQWQLVKA